MFDTAGAVLEVDPCGLTTSELAHLAVAAHDLMEQARLQLVKVIGLVDAHDLHRALGYGSVTGWLKATVPMLDADAARLAALGKRLRMAKVVADAVDTGEVSLTRAEPLLRPLANHRIRHQILDLQATILEHAAGLPTNLLPALAHRIEDELDQDGAEPDRPEKQSEASVHQGDDGWWDLRARLHPVTGAPFVTELQTIIEHLRRDAAVEADDAPKGPRLVGAALEEMAARSSHDDTNPATPTALVIIPADSLDDLHDDGDADGDASGDGGDRENSGGTSDGAPGPTGGGGAASSDAGDSGGDGGAAWPTRRRPTLNGTPLTRRQTRRLLCDIVLHGIVVDSHGAILSMGRATRTATKEQRLALALRDGGCTFPGCQQPPHRCRAHHIAWWTRDHGPTDLHNLCLLCDQHHTLTHQNAWTLHREPDNSYTWTHTPTGRTEHRPAHQHWPLHPT